jgi:pyruvate kinase
MEIASQLHHSFLTKSYIAENVIPALNKLRVTATTFEQEFQHELTRIPAEYLPSAHNLLHYLVLRQSDIRSLQQDLALLGLSRLGRSEAHVLSSLDALLDAACALAGLPRVAYQASPTVDIKTGEKYLNQHAMKLLGQPAEKHGTRIMVTMPSEAAGDAGFVRELLKAGMNIMRINCAHDDAEAWLAMIRHLRSAEKELGQSCKIYADMAGPKLRTGNIRAVGRIIEIKVKRDLLGRINEPTRVWLTPGEHQEKPVTEVAVMLPVPGELLALARARDWLMVDDTRGITRTLNLKKRYGNSWLAHCDRHTFIADGAGCSLYRKHDLLTQGKVSPVPEVFQPILLHVGEQLVLTPDTKIGRGVRYDKSGKKLLSAASIPCTLKEVFAAAKPGQSIWFDDGKIGGCIRSCDSNRIVVEITHAATQGSKLTAGKGINLPQTDLDIPALTHTDIENMNVLAPHIDLIGLSFVRTPLDVQALHRLLEERGLENLGIVLKIETAQAFENLPMILLASLCRPPVGVMVARGDLAVEIGFERLAEVQEEILWLCEAAHIPVIWATQVLESMAKNGMPSRAEVSDAALSIRAECVMLNKGPYIIETVRFLVGILKRMSGHQIKRSPMMRRLSISRIPDREH